MNGGNSIEIGISGPFADGYAAIAFSNTTRMSGYSSNKNVPNGTFAEAFTVSSSPFLGDICYPYCVLDMQMK